jgi:hypothetical protein
MISVVKIYSVYMIRIMFSLERKFGTIVLFISIPIWLIGFLVYAAICELLNMYMMISKDVTFPILFFVFYPFLLLLYASWLILFEKLVVFITGRSIYGNDAGYFKEKIRDIVGG